MVERYSFCSRNVKTKGFGLIEIMISLALGTVIILGVTTLFADSSRALNDITRAGRQMENGLYAMDLLAKELELVDYWGEANAPVDADDPTYGPLRVSELGGLEIGPYPASPPLCVGTGVTGFDPRVELAWAMEYPLLAGLGSEINTAVATSQCTTGATTASASAAFLAVRRASTCATGPGAIATSNNCGAVEDFFYLQTNGCYDENAGISGGEVRLHRTDSAGMGGTLDYTRYGCNANLPTTGQGVAPIYRYISRIYYVNQRDQLIRLSLEKLDGVGMGYEQEILVEGVEDLQFQWLIDDSGNGVSDRSTRTLAHADAGNAIGAKIWLMVRNLQPKADYTDDTSYTMAGQAWSVPAGMASYPRTLQSRTVSLPNRVGRRR